MHVFHVLEKRVRTGLHACLLTWKIETSVVWGVCGAMLNLDILGACFVRGYILDRASTGEVELAFRRETRARRA